MQKPRQQDLYRMREQSKMAAFMPHQSAEQALLPLLKIGIGFHVCKHNIDLFSLLQKAYIGTWDWKKRQR